MSHSSSGRPTKALPGNAGVWLFIFIEVTTFALLFLTYSVLYRLNYSQFEQYKAVLHLDLGVINTIMLLTASLFVALAVHKAKSQQYSRVAWYLALAMLCGCAYIGIKFWEWQQLYSLGYSLHTNTFFSFYFFLTLFHWLHVLLALVILNNFRSRYQKASPPPDLEGLQSAGSYWHMVDMLWLILFLLIYII